MTFRHVIALFIAFAAVSAFALEGKWTPQQLAQLDAAWLAKEGLRIPASKLWNQATGTGLLSAAIQVGGCSAGFIAPDGLFITNHHCLFSALQEHATPQNDLITNGFLARSRDQELRSKTLRVTVPKRFTDVTSVVLAAVPANATDEQRIKALDLKASSLVADCEKTPGARCHVAAHDGGVQYVLAESFELPDVRLVYAPPRAVGEFGGEVDNWMWPRHTGDFAIGRAYDAEGKPFRTPSWFPIAPRGAAPGDFVMILGYPGTTYRALTAQEMRERRDFFFDRRAGLYAEWIRTLEAAAKGNAEGEIAIAANVKTLANRVKNAEGQLAGFRRGNILEAQLQRDAAVLEWAKKQPSQAGAITANKELETMVGEQLKTWDRDFLLSHLFPTPQATSPLGPKGLLFAAIVARSATERAKPEADRDPLYRARDISRVGERLERERKNFYRPSDAAFLEGFVKRALALPADQRIPSIDAAFGGGDVRMKIDEMYASTKIFDPAQRKAMFAESVEELRTRKDPLIELGFALDRDIREWLLRKARWDGMVARLRPQWRRAVIAHAGKPVAPDANSTLRISFAKVGGYEPRDGVRYVPHTTLKGILEKHTDQEPFDVPDALLAAARARNVGPWRDAALGDVPVNFLSDGDTTGGNSGSPTLNGKGELVGVNFDRVWENVANDFGYNPAVNRNINVDIRYALWILDRVEGATALLKELGISASP